MGEGVAVAVAARATLFPFSYRNRSESRRKPPPCVLALLYLPFLCLAVVEALLSKLLCEAGAGFSFKTCWLRREGLCRSGAPSVVLFWLTPCITHNFIHSTAYFRKVLHILWCISFLHIVLHVLHLCYTLCHN